MRVVRRPRPSAGYFPTLTLAGAAAVAAFVIFTSATATAQDEAGEKSKFALDPIVVTATREAQPILSAPASISVLEKPDIQEARETTSLTEPLNQIPGVFAQDSGNYAQDTRIQIRGFGTRAAFGVREIKVLVDGLPETLPDGQTQLDGIDLDSMQRIEVLRGPASSLYGNASGGVIQFFTQDGPERPEATVRLLGGSYSLGKYELKGGGTWGPAKLFMQGSYFQIGGYREQSASQTGVINGKLRYDFGPNTTATLLLNGYDSPEAQDPGGLTTAQVHENRRQARKVNVDLDAGEEVQQVRLGGTASHRAGPHEFSGYAYALYRNFDSNLPVMTPGQGIVTFERVSPGGGARYVYSAPVLGLEQQFALGFDAQYQEDDRSRYTNDHGMRGALGVSQTEQVTGVGPYFREAVFVTPNLELSGGLRYDLVHFAVDTNFPTTENGSENFNALSPGGGVLYTASPWLSLFFNGSTAFQVPTTTELENPDGAGFNPNLEPQKALSFEMGSRAETDLIRGGLALYYVQIKDELIPFESTSGRTAFRNAGRSQRYGLEVNWDVFLPFNLRWSSAVTALHARFQDYVVDMKNFAGNHEPGIPPWQIYEEVMYRHSSGLFAAVEGFLVGGYFVNDGNSARSRGYEVVNLRAGYSTEIAGFTVAPFLGLNNVTNSLHDGTVRLNALNGSYYEPAPGFNVYGGIGVTRTLWLLRTVDGGLSASHHPRGSAGSLRSVQVAAEE